MRAGDGAVLNHSRVLHGCVVRTSLFTPRASRVLVGCQSDSSVRSANGLPSHSARLHGYGSR
jgi:hypothetical protein